MQKTETARDLMSAKIITVKSDTTCEDAMRLIVDKRVSGLPVVDEDGVLVGVISMYDFMKASLNIPCDSRILETAQLLRMAEKGTLDVDNMLEAFVGDFMTRTVCTVGPDAARETVRDLMREKRIHRVIVVDEESGKPLGVISTVDMI
ncbi:MAG: HPP family protein [Candidatus Melainabacteria bacterium]